MIELKSGNVTNSKVLSNLKENKEVYNKFVQKGKLELLSVMIFESDPELLRKRYNEFVGYISLGDEWKVPIDKGVADLLFFSLCVNSSINPQVHINNITQANVVNKIAEGDYEKVKMLESDNSGVRFETYEMKEIPYIFPGTVLTWKIPVRFIKNKTDGRTIRLFGSQKYGSIIINGQEYQIPRYLLLQFLKDNMNGKKLNVMAEQNGKIGDFFNKNDSAALNEVFQYIGFHKEFQEYMKIPQGVTFLEDGVLKTSVPPENSTYWTKQGNMYSLLPKLNYIAVTNKNITEFNIFHE